MDYFSSILYKTLKVISSAPAKLTGFIWELYISRVVNIPEEHFEIRRFSSKSKKAAPKASFAVIRNAVHLSITLCVPLFCSKAHLLRSTFRNISLKTHLLRNRTSSRITAYTNVLFHEFIIELKVLLAHVLDKVVLSFACTAN